MARGTGLTTKMLKEIDWANRERAFIVVLNRAQINYTLHLLHSMYDISIVRKAMLVTIAGARHNLLGRSANDVFVDHAVWEALEYKEECEWLKEFLKRATR